MEYSEGLDDYWGITVATGQLDELAKKEGLPCLENEDDGEEREERKPKRRKHWRQIKREGWCEQGRGAWPIKLYCCR